MKERKERQIELKIEKLTKKGKGRGTFTLPEREVTVEVPFALPGELVKATVFKRRRGVWHARLDEIVISSPSRTKPRCSHVGTCGGCHLQQMKYEDQLLSKQEVLYNLFLNLIMKDTALLPLFLVTLPGVIVIKWSSPFLPMPRVSTFWV